MILGWGFGQTQNSAGITLNGASLGGYTDQIYAANSSGNSTLSFGNESSNYKTIKLSIMNPEKGNNVAITYGINQSISVYADGKSQTIYSPLFSFQNYVGATVSYSSSTVNLSFSPEVFYIFVVQLPASYIGLSYVID